MFAFRIRSRSLSSFEAEEDEAGACEKRCFDCSERREKTIAKALINFHFRCSCLPHQSNHLAHPPCTHTHAFCLHIVSAGCPNSISPSISLSLLFSCPASALRLSQVSSSSSATVNPRPLTTQDGTQANHNPPFKAFSVCPVMSSRNSDGFQVVAISPNVPSSSAVGMNGDFSRMTIMSAADPPNQPPHTDPAAVAFVKGGKRKRLSKACDLLSTPH